MDQTDQPNSICHVQPIQMYQLPSVDALSALPFKLLAGEGVFHQGTSVDGLIVLTNYRLYLQVGDNHHHVPLGLLEAVEHRELFYLHMGCKDARTYRCTFENNESCLEWFDRISKAAETPRQLEQIFAFYHFIWSKDKGGDGVENKIQNSKRYSFDYKPFKEEMERLQFEGDSWRISEANKLHKLCPTYPPYLIVPSCITDETLECVAKFRSSRRIPAVVWRHARNGAVIARCSQPEVGWLGWRSGEDEDLIKAISQACNFDQGAKGSSDKDSILSHSPGSLHSEDSLQITADINTKEKKVLIMDARSYTTAVANRARGGGCECPEYYPNCEIQFMNLANIHSIRKSFHALRLLCTSSADQPNWFSQLEGTRWLQHMSGLMKAAVTLVNAVEREARPVLVHCSDGWDRTPQIVALAELLLDPYYRTIEGFRILIEREWLAFGHKFADRCGHSSGSDDQNERCPVFLQWLDCVHQLVNQFSCAFEFSHTYLVKLAQHIYSNLYGTFLCNTFQERMKVVSGKTFSVWEFLSSARFRNHLYAPPGNSCGNKVLWPQCNVRDLQLWNEVYLGSWEANFSTDGGSGSCPGPPESSPQHMTKTRSYGDLMNVSDVCPTQFRRSSDPSINIDKKLTVLTSETSQEIPTPPQDNNQQQQQQQQTNGVDFLCNGNNATDDVGCNNDCLYKSDLITSGSNGIMRRYDDDDLLLPNNGNASSDSDGSNFLRDHVINGDKTDRSNDCGEIERNFNNICLLTDDLTSPPSYGDRHNGNTDPDFDDNESTERSESKSDNTMCDVGKSVETSTDTLVLSENVNGSSSSPGEVNGFEKLQSPVDGVDVTDGCKVCAQNLKFVNDTHSKDNGKTSKYAALPFSNSRTTSRSSWDQTLTASPFQKTWQIHPYSLGDDGLVPVRSVAQERLWQIIEEHKRKEELLEKELHTYRQALIKQCCHKCSKPDSDRVDDASDSETDSSKRSQSKSKSCSPQRISSPVPKTGSVVESLCSAGEGQVSAGESIRSDMSWENLEENRLMPECTTTLWVPDHAVDRCMECHSVFWAGRRKHHCRLARVIANWVTPIIKHFYIQFFDKDFVTTLGFVFGIFAILEVRSLTTRSRKCGQIFCASCSEYTTPLPSEQLYNPVRVCYGCYSNLRGDCGGEPPDQCKNGNGQPTNSNPQITASSN